MRCIESGVREVIGLDIGEVESGAFWVEFLRCLEAARAGRRAPGDLRSARGAQGRDRPRAGVYVAALHSALLARHGDALPPRSARARRRGAQRGVQRRVREQARERVGHVLERLGEIAPKVCELLEAAEEDLIAFYTFPSRALDEDPLDQPAGAGQQGDRPAHRRRRDLPQRRCGDPPRRRAALRAERRMARPAPLPLGGVDGADPRRSRPSSLRPSRRCPVSPPPEPPRPITPAKRRSFAPQPVSGSRGGCPPRLPQNRTYAGRIRLFGTAGYDPRRRPVCRPRIIPITPVAA